MFVPVWLSINLAYRFRPVYAKLSNELDRYRQMIDPLRRVAMIGVPALLGTVFRFGNSRFLAAVLAVDEPFAFWPG
jgi:hypothetical protein